MVRNYATTFFALAIACATGTQNDRFKIGFASCHNQKIKTQPMWQVLQNENLDLLLAMGDNVYADKPGFNRGRMPATKDELYQAYFDLFNHSEFKRLRAKTPILATVDDHDYGINDGDKTWSLKEDAKHLLTTYFDDDERLGIASRSNQTTMHTVWRHQLDELTIRVILLDNRFEKDQLTATVLKDEVDDNQPQDMLGSEQWQWLEQELRNNRADLTLLGSGLQMISQDKLIGEQWGRFPASLAKLLSLLQTTNTSVLLLSGDIHMAEASRIKCGFSPTSFWEMTSSGLTHSWQGPRSFIIRWLADGLERVGEPFLGLNAGVVGFACKQGKPCSKDTTTLTARIVDRYGKTQMEHAWSFKALLRQPSSSLADDNHDNTDLVACAASDPHTGLTQECKAVLAQCSPKMTLVRQQHAARRSQLLLALFVSTFAYALVTTLLLCCKPSWAVPRWLHYVLVPVVWGWLLSVATNKGPAQLMAYVMG